MANSKAQKTEELKGNKGVNGIELKDNKKMVKKIDIYLNHASTLPFQASVTITQKPSH